MRLVNERMTRSLPNVRLWEGDTQLMRAPIARKPARAGHYLSVLERHCGEASHKLTDFEECPR